jgi:fibronectin type 3 domain-containing protein
VTAENTYGESPTTSPVNVVPQETPTAPTGLSANGGPGEVILAWIDSPGATGYNIYEASSQNGPYSKINSSPESSTIYQITGLTNGTTYYFEVTSVNGNGEGSPTAAVSATPGI